MGGIESSFQFISYKIDAFQFDVKKDLHSLAFNGLLSRDQVEMGVGVRTPVRVSKKQLYVGGLDLKFSFFRSSERNEENRMASGAIGIAGLFKTVGDLTPEIEENLVRLQIPTILFPYLRSGFTSMLTSAGYVGATLPLINVVELAKQAGDKLQIQELNDATPSAPVSQLDSRKD